jgi:hypothetical protein
MSPHCLATPAGIRYPAQAGASAYLCRYDHRPNAAGWRNKWCGLPDEEYVVFVDAEINDWRDARPQLWGLVRGLTPIGTVGECIAKFPEVANSGDDWHGYPVSALDPRHELEHRPETDLVNRWRRADLITDRQASRIKRGKV